MSKIGNIKKIMKKENVNASLGGKVVSSFLKRHPEIVSELENFINHFPCFKKITEVLAWLQNNIKIKKCVICGNRIDYQKGKRDESLFCSMKCRKSPKGNEIWKSTIKSDNPFTREEIKEKIRKTNLEKYGVEYIGQSKEAREKMKQTMMERYGVEHNSQLKSHKHNCLSKGYEKLVQKLNSFNLEMITPYEEYHGIHQQNCKVNIYKLKCKNCEREFDYKFVCGKDIKYACPHCYPCYRSRGEEEINKFISQYHTTFSNNRTVLEGDANPELDIYIPEKKVAIEYNGLYWHSEIQGKDKNYHLNKTKSCESHGIRLIQIFEDEWRDKSSIVKNRLKNILGLIPRSIYARNCEVKDVDNALAKKFVEKYHIQGYCSSSIRLGLFYKNRLVALMTFGKSRFNKNYDWELLRYVTIGSFNIVGGAGKLLSYFRKNYQGSIISYADRRWSQGNLYYQLGFILLSSSEPAYFYAKDGMRYSRVMFQKHKLKNILEIYDENLSERENMENNGYHRIYDCGTKVFILK